MDKIYQLALKYFGMKYLVAGYRGLEGYKTQIGMVLGGVVFAARAFHKITDQQAMELYAGIGTWTGKSFIDKLNRYQGVASELALDVQKQSLIEGSGASALPLAQDPASPK